MFVAAKIIYTFGFVRVVVAKVVGQVISGSFGSVVVRQKSGFNLEIGQLLTACTSQGKVLMQVFDLAYGSQLSQQSLEMISGMKLEGENDLEVLEPELRNYSLAYLRPLLIANGGVSRVCKTLPDFFSSVNELELGDGDFLEKPENPLMVGHLRSGSSVVDVCVYLDGCSVLSHHVLIAAQTGRGKSNLMSCIVSNAVRGEYAGFLILDPHDEYYGRSRLGLKDVGGGVVYYTPDKPPVGARTLVIHVSRVRPVHFNGVVFWSDPQREALYAYYKRYGSRWIESVLLDQDERLGSFHEATLGVVRRRLLRLLSLEVVDGEVCSRGIFSLSSGKSTVSDVVDGLERSKAVVVDTSSLSGQVEILVGSIIATEVFSRYQRYKADSTLDSKPVVSIVLEEAPRVLGADVLERGQNVFSMIAREGRKFKIGLTAITQLPSLIPRQILSNMGTKIILGLEMAPERKAVIESAAQDLSRDDRAIASLDVGEAIVTSTFSKFAVPVKIPLFSGSGGGVEAVYESAYPGLDD